MWTPPTTTTTPQDHLLHPRPTGRVYEPVISDMKLNKAGNAHVLFLLKKGLFRKIAATSSGRSVEIFFIPKNKLTHRRRKMAANFTNASTLPRSAALSLLNNVPALLRIHINGRLTNKCVTFRLAALGVAAFSATCWIWAEMTPCWGQLDFTDYLLIKPSLDLLILCCLFLE